MKRCLCPVLLCATMALARLSGTYTVKPDSTGDFISLHQVGDVLRDSGISGDCIFELYGDTLEADCYIWRVSGNDSWGITFQPGPEQKPVASHGHINASEVRRLRIQNLELARAGMVLKWCLGCRISRCRVLPLDVGIWMEGCSSDTIDASVFLVSPWGERAMYIESGRDNDVFNNVVTFDTTNAGDIMVWMTEEANSRFVYNTVRHVPDGPYDGSCLRVDLCDRYPLEVKNNIFILSWPSPALSACATLGLDPLDSLLMDYNCYFVESLGYIGANERPDYYDWRTWLSFGVEAHGINADPLVFGSDPHLGPGSPCIGAAVPIPGFDYDIDGDPRDPMHPDMGADEYTGPEPESRDNSWPSPRNARPQCAVLRTLPDGLVFNAMGRRVTEPRSGIYFVVSEPSAASSRKIVLTE